MGAVASTNIVTDGLVACFDAGNRRSYPGTGTTWTDIVSGSTASLANATFASDNGGCIEFDGTDDYFVTHELTFRSFVMWTYSDDFDQSGKYFLDGRTGMSNGYILDGANGNDWRQDGGARMYIDAVEEVETRFEPLEDKDGQWQHVYLHPINTYTCEMTFFARYTAANFLEGKIANIYFYDRTLTDAEILQNYNATKGRFS